MRIDLDDKFCITADDYNFILKEKSIVEKDGPTKGDEVLKVVGYHGHLAQALESYAKKATRNLDVNDFKDLLTALATINKTVQTVGREFIAKYPPPKAGSSNE